MPKPTKLLIICWGFSIHAQRGGQIFTEDPDFSVTVASTHNYNFAGANNILLTAARIRRITDYWQTKTTCKYGRLLIKICTKILTRPELTALADWLILWQTVQQDRPDVILLQTLLYPNFLAYALPKSIPQIVNFWNGDITWWAKWNGIEQLCKKYLVTYGARRAAAITVDAQSAYNAALSYGVDPQKVHIISYPGTDLAKFHPLDQQLARQKLGLTAQQIIFWPRGLGGYFNSKIFIRAMVQVAPRFPGIMGIVFTKVGGPAELVKHQQLAEDLGISDKFLWIDGVKFDEMPWYYASANAMISISSNDTRPNVMLEAMACGVPVIMGDIPQIRGEWVRDGENGYLVPPRDVDCLAQAIIQVLDPACQALNQTYIERNRQLVHDRVDHQKSIILIKQLVHQVAHASASGQ